MKRLELIGSGTFRSSCYFFYKKIRNERSALLERAQEYLISKINFISAVAILVLTRKQGCLMCLSLKGNNLLFFLFLFTCTDEEKCVEKRISGGVRGVAK